MAAEEVLGKTTITYQGEEYDFGKPFVRMTVFDSILHFNPDLTAENISTREAALKVAENLKIPVKDGYGLGKIQIEIFALKEDFIVKIDQLRLQQVVINLLSNAVKFSKAYDVITVKLFSSDSLVETNKVELEI